MRALIKTESDAGAGKAMVDIPRIVPGEILVRVQATSICGTDLHIYQWDPWAYRLLQLPRRFGHELAGDVAEVGEAVTFVQPGDLVSSDSHSSCSICYQCRTGRRHICANLSFLDVDVDGCFGDYTVTPETSAWKNAPTMPPRWPVCRIPWATPFTPPWSRT